VKEHQRREGEMRAVGVGADMTLEGGNMGTVTIDGIAIQDMVQSALAFSAQKTALQAAGEVQQAVAEGDCVACGYLRYALSKEVGEYLGTIDTSVQAVYAYEPEYAAGALHVDSVRPAVDNGINLIVSVDRKNAALSSIVASLEDAIKEGVKSLLCSKANGSCYAFDVRVVDGDEVASRRGYGALISSIYATPVRLWARDDAA
jgi:hypothetical protein